MVRDGFEIDADLSRASTLPARFYVDGEWLGVEKERVFGCTWQLVGRAERVARDGDYFTAEIAGKPIVVVRSLGALRGFYNVCRHRAGPVATGCGQRQTLQCRYHGWTYALDGTLIRAPEMEGVQGFVPEQVRLAPVRVARWGPLVF